MASELVQNTQSTDDYRKQKQLQEARASGTAAPVVDEASGQIINPHNPMFLTQAPWYLGGGNDSLKHQKAWNMKELGTKNWYVRGTKGDVKTKFLKGACENCGAMTHKSKDCVERPRKTGAKFTGKNLMPDEYIQDLQLDWDGKRDRWNGFEADDYKQVMEEWEKIETERRRKKASDMEEKAKMRERLKAQKRALKKKRKLRRRQLRRMAEGKDPDADTDTDGHTDSDVDSDTDTDSSDSDTDASDDEDLGEKMKDKIRGTNATANKDDKLRTTTRNLRIREDTAKYLLNLDVGSAFYDPKSRSMRDDPLKHLNEDDKAAFRGDNFVRNTGDAKELTKLMLFAWDSYKHGEKIHDLANPTQAHKMHDVYKNRSKNLKEEQQKELLEKYGGEDHLEAPRELLFSQNENYVEYSRDGRVTKGRERQLVKSKYEEDVLIGNHSSVWGSYWDSGSQSWGFKCCRQCLQHAYCIPQKRESTNMELPPAEAGGVAANPEAGIALESREGAEKVDDDEPAEVSSQSSKSSSSDDEGGKTSKKADPNKRRERALKGLKLFGEKDAAAASAAAAGVEGGGASGSSSNTNVEVADPSKLSDQKSSAFGHVLEEVTDFDAKKLQDAVGREKANKKKRKAEQAQTLDDERKRGYNCKNGDSQQGEINAEDYEAYRLTRSRADDPMANFT